MKKTLGTAFLLVLLVLIFSWMGATAARVQIQPSFEQGTETGGNPPAKGGARSVFNIWEGTGGGAEGATCNIRPYHCTICDGAIVTVNIIELLLALGVIIAVLITLYGGVRLMTAGGSQTQLSQAKGIIRDAVIGLIIVSCAWLIVATVFRVLTTKTDWNVLDIIGCQGGNLENSSSTKK